MDICSKIKYHAVLRDKTGEAIGSKGFASLNDFKKFHPKMSAHLFTQYVKNVRNFQPEDDVDVPVSGLPDGSCFDNDGAQKISRHQQQPARRTAAEAAVKESRPKTSWTTKWMIFGNGRQG
jgi:hypothetical protein